MSNVQRTKKVAGSKPSERADSSSSAAAHLTTSNSVQHGQLDSTVEYGPTDDELSAQEILRGYVRNKKKPVITSDSKSDGEVLTKSIEQNDAASVHEESLSVVEGTDQESDYETNRHMRGKKTQPIEQNDSAVANRKAAHESSSTAKNFTTDVIEISSDSEDSEPESVTTIPGTDIGKR